MLASKVIIQPYFFHKRGRQREEEQENAMNNYEKHMKEDNTMGYPS